MQTINVHTPFVVTHDDHSKQAFAKGLHDVTPEMAAHWYVRAHSEPVAAKEATPTEAEAEALKAAKEAEAQKLAEEAAKAADAEAIAAAPEPEAKKKK